jgi:hypothetical protein
MRRALLSEHLVAASAVPFAWGHADCLAFVSDWVARATGRDPLADWRGLVPDEPAARAGLVRHGGFTLTFRTACRRAGLAPADAPALGDIGLVPVETSQGRRFTCAICLGDRWAVRTLDGIAVFESRAANVFRVA